MLMPMNDDDNVETLLFPLLSILSQNTIRTKFVNIFMISIIAEYV